MATIVTKASEILIAPWTQGVGGEWTEPAKNSAMELSKVIADTLSVTQDDPETNDIDCETSDEPIYTTTTAGKYTFELNNASFDAEYLEKVAGWKKGEGYIAAPKSYASRYISAQVKFEETGKWFYFPKIQIAPKQVLESLKTNVAYGTLSGTLFSHEVSVGSEKVESPYFILDEPILTEAE